MTRALPIVFLLTVPTASAQTAAVEIESAAQAKTTTLAAEYMLIDPTLLSASHGVAPQVSFNIDESQKTVKIQYGILSGTRNTLGLTLSGSLNEAGSTSLLTLDGLDDGTSVEFTFNHTTSASLRGRERLTFLEATAHCQTFFARGECRAVASKTAFRPEFRAGMSAKIGRKNFEFFENDGTDKSLARYGWSVAASGGMFANKIPWLLVYGSVSLKRASVYAAQDPAEFCTPINESSGSRCKTLPFGAPADKKSTIAQLDLRENFGSLLAMTPRIRYTHGNQKSKNGWGIAVPIFMSQAKGANGGLQFLWDKKNKFGVGVFVAALGGW